MGSLFALPFVDSELSGQDQIRVNVESVGESVATVSWSGLRWCYTQAADDLGAAVAAALSTATGLPISYDWDAAGRLELYVSASLEVTLLWTHADSTFPAAWIGHDASADKASKPLSVFTQKMTAPWQGGRLWMPESTIYAWKRPRRDVAGFASRGRRVATRSTAPWYVVRPLFDAVPAPRLYRDAADPDLMAALMPSASPSDPNLSLEASLWEPWRDDRQPLRYTRDQSDTSAYMELQVDPDRGGLEWLADLDAVTASRERGPDESDNYYSVGPMPWMTWQG